MKMNKFFTIIILFTGLFLQAQKRPAYRIFKANGKKTSYKKMLKTTAKADLVFFGEEHDNPVAHWLELVLTEDLYQTAGKPLILGAEMMETDNQKQVNQYLSGEIDYKTFKKEARLWPNFKTDYKALLDFAKEKHLPFIATNIPRRYAGKVYHGGFKSLDSLPSDEKKWIAPLPIKYDKNLSQYQKMLKMMKGHGGENLPKAQAVKDATMAYNILKNYKKGNLFIHYNGSYHSNVKQGIIWYIQQEKPNLKIISICVETQDQLNKLDKKHLNKADFIIVTDKDFPRSY
jgi:uncharacterized iron-regulated protein